MKTKFTAYVHKTKYATDEHPYCVKTCRLEDYGDVFLDAVEVEVEFTTPSDQEILSRAVAVLREEKQKIEAEAYVRAKAIQDKIDSLLCIEHKEESQVTNWPSPIP